MCRRPPLDRRCGCGGVPAGLHETGAELLHRPDAHEEDQSPIQTGQSLEVPVRQVPVPRMGGDDVHRRRGAPMRHRYPGAGQGGESRGHAGHHLERDTVGQKRLDLLAAAPEQERVPALEADDPPARKRAVHQERLDLPLGHRMASPLLADIQPLGPLGKEGEEPGAHQPVEHHHLRPLQDLPAPQRQQPRIARPGPDEPDLSHGLVLPPFAPHRSSVPPSSHRVALRRSASSRPRLPASVLGPDSFPVRRIPRTSSA